MSIDFDPSMLKDEASLLVWKARFAVVRYVIMFAVAGAFAGAVVSGDPPLTFTQPILLGVGIGALFGWDNGRAKARDFRVQAQQLLALHRIEANTRTKTERAA